MNQQPDKFFREKLAGYEKPAPSSAWDKIISAERKKKHRAIWLNIAASVLPLTLAAYILWPSHAIENSDAISSHKENTQKHESAKPSVNNDDSITVDKKNLPSSEERSSPLLSQTKKEKRSDSRRAQKVSTDNGLARSHDEMNSIDPIGTVNVVLEDNKTGVASIPEEVVTPNVAKDRSTITLVYTANDVSKYLDKNQDDEATSSLKKPSTLQKLLKKANDLSAQDPVGELRQKKNEILALNFKSKGNADKTSKQ